MYPNALPWRPLPVEVKRSEEIVFSGNLEYQPNQSAVRWFAREVWPGIRRELPHVTWKLIGKNEHAVRALLASVDGVVLTGAVDDAVRELGGCRARGRPARFGQRYASEDHRSLGGRTPRNLDYDRS